MTITDDDRATLMHMLGIVDTSRRDPAPTRDYFAAEPGDEGMARLLALGLVERCGDAWGYEYHRTTASGREAATAAFYRLRQPKSKRIYSRFLELRDVFPDMTFREFLTSDQFAETRRGN